MLAACLPKHSLGHRFRGETRGEVKDGEIGAIQSRGHCIKKAVNKSPVVNARLRCGANQKDEAAASTKSQGEAGKSVAWERSTHRRKTGELERGTVEDWKRLLPKTVEQGEVHTRGDRWRWRRSSYSLYLTFLETNWTSSFSSQKQTGTTLSVAVS